MVEVGHSIRSTYMVERQGTALMGRRPDLRWMVFDSLRFIVKAQESPTEEGWDLLIECFEGINDFVPHEDPSRAMGDVLIDEEEVLAFRDFWKWPVDYYALRMPFGLTEEYRRSEDFRRVVDAAKKAMSVMRAKCVPEGYDYS